ncbi:MAG: hypothetical protein Q4G07_03870 [Oscillospiraceae bacterium]|nr:hypothetical protein [Oscillospiraceae bacterium]
MSEQGLIAKGTRKSYHYQPNKNAYGKKENILNRFFAANEKNKVWVGDTTYIPTKHGWLYLTVFIGIFPERLPDGRWTQESVIRLS